MLCSTWKQVKATRTSRNLVMIADVSAEIYQPSVDQFAIDRKFIWEFFKVFNCYFNSTTVAPVPPSFCAAG